MTHRIHPHRTWPALALLLAACGPLTACGPADAPAPRPTVSAPPRASDPVTLTILGTSDLHGHLRALPLLASHLDLLRRERSADGGGVVLVDAGDMFQGTLESNLEGGASVVLAYAALGYDAVAIGNHEFDFGPIGERTTAREPGDDPRGALLSRIAQAPYPFLSTNLRRSDDALHPPLGLPSVLVDRVGVSVGIIGVTTESTPHSTIAANFSGLAVAPLAAAISDEARSLRARGAVVVVVAAHAGGRCTEFTAPDDLSSCSPDQEIMTVARALAPGSVDVIVAGHTHQAMAHRVAGVAIVQSYARGVAYGRVDLTVDRAAGAALAARIHPPRRLCRADDGDPEQGCASLDDHGQPADPDPALAALLAPSLARADLLRARPLGPRLQAPFVARHRGENPLGNLLTDLMLRARPGADAAILNGGGLRADLPAGPLLYGALYESFPFDNRFATVQLRADQLAALIARGLAGDGTFLSIGGLTATARCLGDAPVVTLARDDLPIPPDAALTVLMSDFLATGGDRMLAALGDRAPTQIILEDDPPLREVLADQLRTLGPVELTPTVYYDPTKPRLRAPGEPPLRCGKP